MWRVGLSRRSCALAAGWLLLGCAWGYGQEVAPLPALPSVEAPAAETVAGDVATYADVFGGEEAMSAAAPDGRA